MRIILVALALAVVAVVGAGGAQSLEGPALIRVTAVTDFERDLFEQKVQVSEIRNQKRIGWAVVLCTDLGGGGSLGSATAFCHGSYNFPKGRIQTSGTRKARSSYVMAVVGGTGLYSNVGGVLLVRTISERPRTERLLFSLEP
ncbi:MAG: hypothetical protein H0U59_04255 [Gemmatimonadaceae bacterium]|nr:hypothetical protein [Gemmatimonadaceae bacterium]